MGFKNAFTKLGLLEEEVQVTPKVQQKAAPTSRSVDTKPVETIPVFTPDADPAISEMLQNSLQENKLSGFDYLKFISSVEKMKATGVSEDVRFKMTFSAAEELGVTKKKLLDSGDHYLDVLKQDEEEFNADCDQFEKKEISSRETKLAQTEKTIEDLTKQLAQLQESEATLTQEIKEEKETLENRKAAFQATLETFKGAISSNVDKINQYL